jgi:hypothetical protein
MAKGACNPPSGVVTEIQTFRVTDVNNTGNFGEATLSANPAKLFICGDSATIEMSATVATGGSTTYIGWRIETESGCGKDLMPVDHANPNEGNPYAPCNKKQSALTVGDPAVRQFYVKAFCDGNTNCVKDADEDYYYAADGSVIEVQVFLLKVALTAIKFNHKGTLSDTDPGPTSDGLIIRKDYSTQFGHKDHTYAGEWVPSLSRNEPFLYVADKTVTITARLTIAPSTDTALTIGAESVGGVFPDVTPKAVAFTSGVSVGDADGFVEFDVAGKSHEFDLNSAKDVARSSDSWQWRILGALGTCDINVSGPHTNYCVLDVPQEPWYMSKETQPWVDALDYTCSWAAGETTQDGAAGKVVKGLFDISYTTHAYVPSPYPPTQVFSYTGIPVYTVAGKIRLTSCIERMNGVMAMGQYVNCRDCANFVMAFSNLAGHSLYTSQMYTFATFGYGPPLPFVLNKTTAIGRPSFTGCGAGILDFDYHEVAWNGAAGSSDDVFDATLKVDGDSNPTVNPPGTETYVDGAVFQDGTPGSPYVYRERLAVPGATGYDRCVARPVEKVRRPIE